jgi:hypothetical protein
LECLPPCKHHHVGDYEIFHVSERITYSIVTWCVKIGLRCFSIHCTDKTQPALVIEKIKAKFFAVPEVTA